MLELTATLSKRASGLTADGKQKISLGRGLVRSDVNVIMFDEPLTVIDPHLKWQLRSKLKELQHRIKRTMIYVTHDQTEALTFADQVVVMNNGEVVQTGTPIELFEKPKHIFVGHFIGSPGMNVMPCQVKGGKAFVNGHEVAADNAASSNGSSRLELGIRPEFVTFAAKGLPVNVVKVSDIGRYRVVDTRLGGNSVKLIVRRVPPSPRARRIWLSTVPYANLHRRLVGGRGPMNKTFNNKACGWCYPSSLWLPSTPSSVNDRCELFGPGNLRQQEFFWSAHLVRTVAGERPDQASLARAQIIFTAVALFIQVRLAYHRALHAA